MSEVRKNFRIRTPKENMIWEDKDYQGNIRWRFPYKNSYKKVGAETYTEERYLIYVQDKPEPNTEYKIIEINMCKPEVTLSKGVQYLNCRCELVLERTKINDYNKQKEEREKMYENNDNGYYEKEDNYYAGVNLKDVDDDLFPF